MEQDAQMAEEGVPGDITPPPVVDLNAPVAPSAPTPQMSEPGPMLEDYEREMEDDERRKTMRGTEGKRISSWVVRMREANPPESGGPASSSDS